ncbi:MAG TPA: aconitate hydratase B, partial [Candidatus Aminicenantes bacterium]|nr:aconitate hydratase B [Candidatus Aminicenantes bacterium]
MMLEGYFAMEQERAKAGLPPLPLTPKDVEEVCQGLETADKDQGGLWRGLLENRVSPGVDPAAKVKAAWLAAVAKGAVESPMVTREDAVRILGTMLGGYNVAPLIEALGDESIAAAAAAALKKTVLVYGRFETVAALAASNPHAKAVLD